LASAVRVTDAVPPPEIVVLLAVADSQEPDGETLDPKVAAVPMVFWMVTERDACELAPAVSAILPGMTVRNPLLADPVYAEALRASAGLRRVPGVAS